MRLASIGLPLFLPFAAVASTHAAVDHLPQYDVLFETGVLGNTEITGEQILSQEVTGTSVNPGFVFGFRFELLDPAAVTHLGGHFAQTRSPGAFFGALVELTGAEDYPDSADLTSSDVLGSALIDFPEPSAVAYGALDLQLEPGWYGVVFGSGLFGATGAGAAPRNNQPNPEFSQFLGIGDLWIEVAFDHYYRVLGTTIPEPTTATLLVLGLMGGGAGRRQLV